jgi:hypothetical protein
LAQQGKAGEMVLLFLKDEAVKAIEEFADEILRISREILTHSSQNLNHGLTSSLL